MSAPTISAAEVKALRDRTGAGMMDCKAALAESGGDADKAVEILRVKGQAAAAKRGDRAASEGAVQTYIHHNNRIGAMVEVDCETDFVARTDDFVAFARQVASHVASAAPEYLTADEIPEDVKQAELRIYQEQAADKPENVRPKIAEGRWRKWLEERVLLSQPHVNTDRYDGKTIEELRSELATKTGENVVIRRFVRFAVGD